MMVMHWGLCRKLLEAALEGTRLDDQDEEGFGTKLTTGL